MQKYKFLISVSKKTDEFYEMNYFGWGLWYYTILFFICTNEPRMGEM